MNTKMRFYTDNLYPGFNSPIWRNSIILLVAGVGFYRVSTLHGDAPSTNRSEPVDGSEEEQNQHQENGKDNRPFITRYIDYYSTPSNVWKERNERHLDYVREKAEEKLLFQDAERPPVHRFRYSKWVPLYYPDGETQTYLHFFFSPPSLYTFCSTFEQASPHRMAVGAQADLSHLKIKRATE